jgi:serine/threonine protein kinase
MSEETNTPVEHRCPACGDPLPADAPMELCVRCLLGASLREPVPRQDATRVVPPPATFEKAGDRIGRYKLLQEIGEGGFGVVFMAEQTEPVRRRVALKVVKPGMDSKQVVARFEAERQALAMMDHPNIAHVFDGGTCASGRPYFVMELVRGIPITEYCDAKELDLAERLDLFRQVCQALHHAHQKGIVHRDIKPTNVLVTEQDGPPLPKVIDFGVAKALYQPLTEKTLFTAFSQWIGTPAYMSPEQAGLGSFDVDTRSDIYALGVLLYELLTGLAPFSAKELDHAGADGVLRVIREHEPTKPSTRLSTLNEADLSTVAARRRTQPRKLLQQLRGEMDWIVMHAIEKDRRFRYQEALHLADDLNRHVSGQPLKHLPNRPRSALYSLAKALHRNDFLGRISSTLLTASLLVLAVCLVSIALLSADARYRLGLFGEYGPGKIDLRQALGLNILGALVNLLVGFGARPLRRASFAGALLTVSGTAFMAVWAVTVLLGIYDYTAGGLLEDERFRRTIALIYTALYGPLFAVALGGLGGSMLIRRYGLNVHKFST